MTRHGWCTRSSNTDKFITDWLTENPGRTVVRCRRSSFCRRKRTVPSLGWVDCWIAVGGWSVEVVPYCHLYLVGVYSCLQEWLTDRKLHYINNIPPLIVMHNQNVFHGTKLNTSPTVILSIRGWRYFHGLYNWAKIHNWISQGHPLASSYRVWRAKFDE